MKFTIGDTVLLKQTGEEGEIIAFLNKTMLEVSVSGVHFPVFLDEVDHPYLKWFTEEKKVPKKKPREVTILPEKAPPKKLARSIYLSFMPVYRSNTTEDIVEDFRVYLLNETPTPIRFQYTLKAAGGASLFAHGGELHPFGHIFLHTVSFEAMSEQPRFLWELGEAGKSKLPPQSGVLRIRPQKLFAHLLALLESGDPSFTYALAEDVSVNLDPKARLAIPDKILPLHAGTQDAIILPSIQNSVIDLHAASLLENGENMPAPEILRHQLHAVEMHLDKAVVAGFDRIVVIHGIGSGMLRESVRSLLENDTRVERISQDWEGGYGFGATLAYLRMD